MPEEKTKLQEEIAGLKDSARDVVDDIHMKAPHWLVALIHKLLHDDRVAWYCAGMATEAFVLLTYNTLGWKVTTLSITMDMIVCFALWLFVMYLIWQDHKKPQEEDEDEE